MNGSVYFGGQTNTGAMTERLMYEEFPLHRCCRDGDDASLYRFVTAGSHSIFTEDSFYGWTPIHWAARFDHVHCLEVLVKQTALVNSCDIQVSGSRQTPLHVAAELGALNAIRWLTGRGADANQKDYLGETALHKAARCGSLNAIALLANAGARCGARNNEGKAPLDLAPSGPAKNLLQQFSQTWAHEEAVEPDTDMENACDYHNSVNIPIGSVRFGSFPSKPVSFNYNNSKRPRPQEEDENKAKRSRLSSDIFNDNALNLSYLFESPFSTDDPACRALSSPPKASVGGNGFHDDHEGNNGMKTISSRINGNHAATSSSSSAEDDDDYEEDMDDAEGMDSATSSSTVGVGSQLPPHLIPPLAAEGLVDNGIGIPLEAGGRIDNGKSGRSKCVWFRSSCYI